MYKRIFILINIYIFFATIIFSQTLTTRLDSIYNTSSKRIVFLHSLLSLDCSYPQTKNKEFEYKIYLTNSITYFLLFDTYKQRSHKIQILEKGLDKLKIAIKLSDASADSNSKFRELYDDLFNIYYTYKTGKSIPNGNIEDLIKLYSSSLLNNEIMSWFNHKLWRNRCSEN